ncbi:hypothetical protein [Pseudomonas sp. NGC7]|uniref:hypothetical protein n=1 Tax=Pseudomonas sp. NGC7 TaxID=3341775 RepID=UPI00399D2816
MDTSLETAVWARASERYGSELERILDSAISSYKRAPGLEPPSRLYAKDIGTTGLEALFSALLRSRVGRFHVLNPGIEIRHSLRLHLVHSLCRRLLDDGQASEEMRDQHFAIDLGL